MKEKAKVLLTALLAVALCAIVISCQKGPAEKAGEKIDNAVQDTKDAVHDAGHDIKRDLNGK